jgi:hypothetical protein
MCGGGSSGGGGTSTVSQTAIPDWQQGQVQANENIANSLASQPYQTYQGQTVAGFSPLQQQGMNMTTQAATAGQPALNASAALTGAGTQQWNPQTAQQYMSPYAQAALQPQVQALRLQQANDANKINGSATMAGAFGDAQYGNAQALNNFFAGQNLNNLEAQGMNTAYTTGQQQMNASNNNLLAAGAQMGNISNAAQQQGLTGANAVFGMGTQQQGLQQQQLTEAYQNFMNQQNYPYQQLNARIAATANSPYQVPTANLAPTSSSAQNIGAFASLAGGVGSLLGGSGSSGGGVYGGSSDRRIKKAIKEIGKLVSGLNVYEFKYNWEPEEAPKWIGVMADEVEKLIPDAVHEMTNGLKWVDYGKVF